MLAYRQPLLPAPCTCRKTSAMYALFSLRPHSACQHLGLPSCKAHTVEAPKATPTEPFTTSCDSDAKPALDSLSLEESSDGLAKRAEVVHAKTDAKETHSLGKETEANSSTDQFVLKTVKWQLRNAKDFHRLLYILRLPRHEADWQDGSNVAAALRHINRLMKAAIKKEERRAATEQAASLRGAHPSPSPRHKGTPTGQQGLRVGKKGAPPEEQARRGGTFGQFLAVTAANVPLMGDNDMTQVVLGLRSLAANGLQEDVTPALSAIEDKEKALAARKQAKRLAAEQESLARLEAMAEVKGRMTEKASDTLS